VTEIARDYVVIAWEPPSSDGNEQLLGYEVEKSMAGGGGTFVSAGYVDVGTLSFRVTRLHEGCDYMFRVSAENRVGLGQPAITDRPVTVKLPFGESDFAVGHRRRRREGRGAVALPTPKKKKKFGKNIFRAKIM